MKLYSAVVLALAPLALAAQSSNSTSLADLVRQLPPCGVDCFKTAAASVDCSAEDLDCLCDANNRSSFTASAGTCLVLKSSCSPDERNKIATLAGQICIEDSTASSTEKAEASSAVESVVGSASSKPNAASVSGPNPGLIGCGLLGLVVAAALVI